MQDFKKLADYIDDTIAIADKNGVLEYVNNAFIRMSGLNIDNLIGRSLYELVEEGYLSESAGIKVLQLKQPVTMDVRYKSGRIITWTCLPVFGENGEIERVVCTGRDITEFIVLEEELKKSNLIKGAYADKMKTLEKKFDSENHKIVYSSDKMQSVIEIATKAAATNLSVFIWGESGVGKEVVASLIHSSSQRKNMPLISINCAAIPSELLESELFGYEEGAFTGAKKGGKKGLFEEANKGTILLDEIGELSHSLQSKLLRVLDTGELSRVGGSRKVPLDLRIIAATNVSKEQLLNNSKFRQDLFYRLSAIPIYIPPLRDRKEDVLALIRYFLAQFNDKYKVNVKITREVLLRLRYYDWPGNVRELKNVVERLVVLFGSGNDIGKYDTLSQLGTELKEDQSIDISITGLMPIKTAFRMMEEILIKRAYAEHGSIVKAAEVLQINPITIHRRIKEGLKLN
jgi:PAS domain S-box-containing protein